MASSTTNSTPRIRCRSNGTLRPVRIARSNWKAFKTLKQRIAQPGVHWRTPDHVRAQVLAAISQEAAMPARAPARTGLQRAGIRQTMAVRAVAGRARRQPVPGDRADERSLIDQRRGRRQPCPLAAGRSSHRRRDLRSAHRQTLVQRQDRFRAAGGRSRARGISACKAAASTISAAASSQRWSTSGSRTSSICSSGRLRPTGRPRPCEPRHPATATTSRTGGRAA